MAPLRPLPNATTQPKSILKRPQSTSSTNNTATFPPPSKTESLFPTTKKDKRRIKHAHLLSKITKSTNNKPGRRRRPHKKLISTLDSLGDALPDVEATSDLQVGGEAGGDINEQYTLIKRTSLKSRPGAMKRKQKLDNAEKERFAKNLANIVATDSGGVSRSAEGGAAQKLRALRGFIAQTLERRSDIAAVKG